MNPGDYRVKAARAITSAQLLLDAGDVDGACNRAYEAGRGEGVGCATLLGDVSEF